MTTHHCVSSKVQPHPAFPFSPLNLFLSIGGLILGILLLYTNGTAQDSPVVRFTHGKRVVPTYTFSRSETVAPLFKSIENMGHYPYTILDWESRARKPVPVEYESLVLENEYLRVEFLPELGGRIWSARDKVANREIFYHPTVIKPGRYNQRGGWPVGNLELYGPYDAHMLTWPGEAWSWAVRRHPDGDATVVLSHIDHFFRNKISLEVTLHPGKAYLETTLRLHNKNMLPNRYLIWTNAGVATTEGSRFVYPMTKTIGHVSSAIGVWPIIDGVDLSWNKNNKNMLGVFGLDIYDNFMSIYDYQADYGTICYTNRLLARGMKTWTFGSGLTALRQMATYTDNDGLYMETQSGRFIWDGNYEFIDPGKTDGWTEYWFGAGKLGGLTTATRDVAVNLEVPLQRPGKAKLALTATGSFPGAVLELYAGDQKVWSQIQDLVFGGIFRTEFALSTDSNDKVLRLQVCSKDGRSLLDHKIYPDGSHPDAVYASDSIPRKFGPLETLHAEEAYQKGLGHEKFGEMNDAIEAYKAALARDPLFSPVHLRLGLLALDRFQEEKAVEHFEKVLERDPTNGDAHYYLGVVYSELNKRPEARRHYYRLLPSSGKFERRDYGLGVLALSEGDRCEACHKLSAAAALTPQDLSVRQAYAYLLRKEGRSVAAENERKAILELDPTNALARAEQLFAGETSQQGSQLHSDVGGKAVQSSVPALAGADDNEGLALVPELLDRACAHHPQGYLELATEYLRLAAWEEAGRVLDRGIESARSAGEAPYPLLLYYRAFADMQMGDKEAARRFVDLARRQDLKLEIFPFRSEDLKVLKLALKINPADANAAVMLGDILYSRDHRDEAVEIWRLAGQRDPKHFFALRDLGMAMLVEGKQQEGLELLTRASDLRPDHMATTMLVANINARLGNTQAARRVFEKALQAQPQNDQVLEKLASLEAQLGNDSRALELLTAHTFEPTHLSYSLLHLYRGVRLMLALEAARESKFSDALAQVRAAAQPPSSLGVDDFATIKSSRLLMFEALLAQARGDSSGAMAAWRAAAGSLDDDVEGEGLFRAIALYKTGQVQKAEDWFKDSVSINEARKTDNAVDLRLHAYGLAGIYAAFQGDDVLAADNFRKALEIDQSYLYSRQSLAWLQAGMLKGLRR
jgi:tetratricopeptide (TPR) repeat protein